MHFSLTYLLRLSCVDPSQVEL